MPATAPNNKKSNRRHAFRVYEQANLFYQKIEHDQPTDTPPQFDNVLQDYSQHQSADRSTADSSFPFSQSKENDTLNVNISSSGIAFTCEDKLQPGDFLMLRILLLSSMTAVMSCCKVVYCKPSNPFESDRYPYSIGAQFVNITREDSELLKRFVDGRKKRQWILNGFIALLLLTILAAPDQAFDLLLSVEHQLLEIVLHLSHIAFEYLELGLDHIVEHLFHTDRHQTQLIVFYLLATLGLGALYFLGRMLPAIFLRLKNSLLQYWSRKKSSCLYYWSEQTLANKIKIIGLGSTAVACYVYFGM
ncbi:PilZ domain-containing protein [Methylomonas sp. LL1]|uniref:PilZ domain-containing protein n=1 Tax=Methylomonas sp. LL1 TaxID=2785785 RepID=UPI0018C42CD7|nr:PilZ domain-containing protein [Methylomonas sp. LL1]QPK63231.1 PilZ domain-containing protein [Methylomonas sp. LL1]